MRKIICTYGEQEATKECGIIVQDVESWESHGRYYMIISKTGPSSFCAERRNLIRRLIARAKSYGNKIKRFTSNTGSTNLR